MQFTLNRKSLERAKALVRSGDFVDLAFTFTPADATALLGDPENWVEFQLWQLGVGVGVPADGSTNGTAPKWNRDQFAYPFGKGDAVNLEALRQIVRQATAAGEMDIASAAAGLLDEANAKTADKAKSAACDVDIRFGAPVELKAAAGGTGGGKAGGVPTFAADCYTGVAMKLDGFSHPVVIDLTGVDFTAHSRPVLRDHDEKRPIGHTTSVGVEGGHIKAAGEISVRSRDAYEVIEAGKNNFPWQISVGAKVLRSQFVPAGSTAQANGQTWAGPVIVARQTSLREISFLTLGADDNTSATIAARAAQKGATMALKKKFAAWAKARNISAGDMADDGFASAMKAAYKAQCKAEADDPNDEDDDGKAEAAAPAVDLKAAAAAGTANSGDAGTVINTVAAKSSDDVVKEMRAAALSERRRQESLNTTLAEYKADVDPAAWKDIEAKAFTGEYDQVKTELELIKARRPQHAPNINTGRSALPDGSIIAAAMARSVGVGEETAFLGLDEKQGNIASSIRGLTLHAIISASASRLGMHVSPGGIDDSFLADFLRADRQSHKDQIRAHQQTAGPMIKASTSGGFSTMSLTGITENILYKAMLESYQLQPSIVPEIAYERDTNDFKPFKVYRLTASGDIQPVGPAGELKNFSLQDESYSNQVATKGALLVLKREDIINDDMGALMQAPQVLGRKAALNREKTVITAFLSGLTTAAPGASTGKTANGFNFWSTGASNYLSGAGSALAISSVQSARQKFLQQTDANGDPIGIPPDRLLVCPELEGVADNLFNGANLTVQALDLPSQSSGTSAAQTGKQTVNLNQHKGKYRPIMSPFLGGGSGVTGASATQWALLCNPAGGMATVQVGYLRGQRTPIIKQVDTDASMLGLAYQLIYDFGVALLDYRCGVYSAGA